MCWPERVLSESDVYLESKQGWGLLQLHATGHMLACKEVFAELVNLESASGDG